jgi:Concanavalin A-like lectin/glucanases superfamily
MLRGHFILLALGAAVLFTTSATGATSTVWLTLDETSGTLAADSSGNANNGTYTGGPTLGATAPRNLGAYFPSDGIFVTAPASGTLNALGVSNADFSVAFWVKPNGMTGGWRPLLHKGSVDTERGPGLWLNPGSNRVHFRISTTANWNEGTDSVADLPTGAWSHVACVKAGNKWRCYVNGVLDTEFTLSAGTTGNNGPLYVGDDPWFGGSNAYIDDVRLYSGALTDTEVKYLYGFVGHWKFAEGSGATAADSTALANTATLSGGATWETTCAGNNALQTNGTGGIAQTNASFTPPSVGTVAFWMRGAGPSATRGRVMGVNGDWEIRQEPGGTLSFDMGGSPYVGNEPFSTLDPVDSNGKWYHIAAVFDDVDNSYSVYIDGKLRTSGISPVDLVPQAAGVLSFGIRAGSTEYWNGALRDVRIYSRKLGAAEIAALYGLVGHWKFAEGSGATAADSTALANTATLSGGATWETTCAGNNALQTNGTGGIAATTAPFTAPDVGTLAFWMKSTGAPAGTARILGLGGDWELRQQTNGTVVTDLCGDGSTNICTVTPLSVVGRWYHVAFTFDSSNDTYAIYVDGILERSGTNPVNMVQQPAAILSFGTRTGSTEYWNGSLRDVRIYSRKLCPTEIVELYGLVGHWKFDESSGFTASDSSGAGNQGTLNGPTWTTGRVAGGLLFNGTSHYVSVPHAANLSLSQQITLAAWVKSNDLTSKRIAISKGTTANNFNYWLGTLGGEITFGFHNGSYQEFNSTNVNLGANNWHHLAATFDNATDQVHVYRNGIEVLSTTTTASPSVNSESLTIGKDAAGEYWPGVVDDVRVYNRVLCPAEVLALYSGAPFQGVKVVKWVEIQ